MFTEAVEFSSTNAEHQVIFYFLVLLIMEYVFAVAQNIPTVRLNDGLRSLSATIISSIPRLLVTNLQTASYEFVYKNMVGDDYSYELSSPSVWCVTFLGVDLAYYWFHRAAHEINIFWAAHQVHHSSEDFNITTSLRQSVVQQFCSWIFYIPLAIIGIHPSTLKDQLWFSCLYQIWTHTEVVSNLGPLEYVLVTPSHHRVHHGRNPYCIDKNYGGILIIWDRIFGTFIEENENAPVFGLVVERVDSWDPIWSQFSHYFGLIQAFWDMDGISNKIAVLFKGPSWSPGKSRLGDGNYEPVEYPVVKYDRTLPIPAKLYVSGHFVLLLFFYYEYLAISSSATLVQTIAVTIYMLFALTTFGTLFDHKWYAPLMEATRCIIFTIMDSLLIQRGHSSQESRENKMLSPTHDIIRSIFALSSITWFLVEVTRANWTGNDFPLHKGVKSADYPQNTNHMRDVNHNHVTRKAFQNISGEVFIANV